MLSLTLICLVSLVVGERPTEQDQIELLPHGHLVSKKQSSGSHILATEDSSASVHSHLPAPPLSKPGPGSLSELSSSDNDKHEVVNSSPLDATVSASLVQVDEMPGPEVRDNKCQQGSDGRKHSQDACMSLCHRIWCTFAHQGSCDNFEKDLEAHGFLNPTRRAARFINWSPTKAEQNMDFFYWDLRENMPHTKVMGSIRSLKGGVNYSVGSDSLTWSEGIEPMEKFKTPLMKIMRAFNLYEAWEKADAALHSRSTDDLKEIRDQLQRAIDDVKGHSYYDSMEDGLKTTRHVLYEINAFYALIKVRKEAEALSDSSAGLEDDTIDKMLIKLASGRKEADDALGPNFDREKGKLAKVQDKLQRRLDGYFLGIINTAKDKEIMEESGELRKSLDDLRPIITRMTALSPMYNDDQYLPRAVNLVATFEQIFRTKFKEAVRKANDAIKGRYGVEEMQQTQENLQEQITICDPMFETFLDEYNDMQDSAASIEAYVKLQEAINDCTEEHMNDIADADDAAAKAAEEEAAKAAEEEKAAAAAEAAAAEAAAAEAAAKTDDGKAQTDKQSSFSDRLAAAKDETAKDEAARAAADKKKEKAAPKALTAKQQVVQNTKIQLVQNLRTGMDLCWCAGIMKSVKDMKDEAVKLGVKLRVVLGGEPAIGACPVSKRREKGGCYGTNCPEEKKPLVNQSEPKHEGFFKKMMGGLFGGGAHRSMQPAASAFAAYFLLAPVLWMQV